MLATALALSAAHCHKALRSLIDIVTDSIAGLRSTEHLYLRAATSLAGKWAYSAEVSAKIAGIVLLKCKYAG